MGFDEKFTPFDLPRDSNGVCHPKPDEYRAVIRQLSPLRVFGRE